MRAAMNPRVGFANNHHDTVVGVDEVVVIHDGDLQKHLAHMTTCKHPIVVEAESGTLSSNISSAARCLKGRDVGVVVPTDFAVSA